MEARKGGIARARGLELQCFDSSNYGVESALLDSLVARVIPCFPHLRLHFRRRYMVYRRGDGGFS